jgi:hypothetical protein
VPPPAPKTARLEVRAPGAAISIDGAFVGDDRWSTDSIAPGRHVITASVQPAPEGCDTATETLRRTLTAGQAATVTLSPRNCGLLNFTVRPPNDEYTTRFRLTPADESGTPREGLIPLDKALVLPTGRYRVLISRRYCREYEDEQLSISADRPNDVRVTLDCSPPPKT